MLKDQQAEYIEVALGAMTTSGPRDLRAYLARPGPDFDLAAPSAVGAMIDMILSADPNGGARLHFSSLLRAWDNTKSARWTGGTPRNTHVRRKKIHELLKLDPALEARVDGLLPFYPLDEPLMIAKDHVEWYRPVPGRDYYWSAYRKYLMDRRGWSEAALLSLENDTQAVVECLANPEADDAYASRGLVMGYVQSGKTANFMGVVSRAADAGYRLIIVLAGTWNILRNQTQRRFDKELLGKQLLANDEHYTQRKPADWDEFLDHGGDPVDEGHYTWQRLTRPEIDLKRLKAAIDNLEFERRNKALPIYHPENLHALPAKLLVIKKHSGILKGLVSDLKLLRTRLATLPTLVIDDESDQAGINTVDPRKPPAPGKERTSTNREIVKLLQLLPRGQYVGYTATPYANAFVDPNDPADLFPKDFIFPLGRPVGYMGVADFFDPLVNHADLDGEDFSEPEIAFIRRVDRAHGDDDADLMLALRSYVLAGAIKLFRGQADPGRYKSEYFRHHTMLIHTSHLKGDHLTVSDRVQDLWNQCAFNTPGGKQELKRVWEDDFCRVSATQGTDEVVPATFDALVPHLAAAIQRIQSGDSIVRVVNSDRDEAPDFSAGPIWNIIVGGNKLSRGYTIEGLTVSFYRRVANNADTLMQMGRWFGFRPGYRDLVRVFLGVRDGRQSDVDLVALFKDVCLMEDRFRNEIERYRLRPGVERITPEQVAPLVFVTGNIPPTSRNKMFHARLVSKNFGGDWSMPTLMPREPGNVMNNIGRLEALLASATESRQLLLGGRCADGSRTNAQTTLFYVSNEQVIAFLKAFRWLESEYGNSERPAEIQLQIEFLEKEVHGIRSWLVLAPQRRDSYGAPVSFSNGTTLTVKRRTRGGGRGFEVIGEPRHRAIAEYLTEVVNENRFRLEEVTTVMGTMRDKQRGCLLIYPVRPSVGDAVSIGFEVLFPGNRLPQALHFSVQKKAKSP